MKNCEKKVWMSRERKTQLFRINHRRLSKSSKSIDFLSPTFKWANERWGRKSTKSFIDSKWPSDFCCCRRRRLVFPCLCVCSAVIACHSRLTRVINEKVRRKEIIFQTWNSFTLCARMFCCWVKMWSAHSSFSRHYSQNFMALFSHFQEKKGLSITQHRMLESSYGGSFSSSKQPRQFRQYNFWWRSLISEKKKVSAHKQSKNKHEGENFIRAINWERLKLRSGGDVEVINWKSEFCLARLLCLTACHFSINRKDTSKLENLNVNFQPFLASRHFKMIINGGRRLIKFKFEVRK